MIRTFFTLALGFIPLFYIHAQQVGKIQALVQEFAQDPVLKYATVGFMAIDIDQNTIEGQWNADQALIPASSLKIVTTSTAIALLGCDYKFKTELQYDGYIENGILKGNLYIKGGGDPTLASPYMANVPSLNDLMISWVNAIKKAGIMKIEGSIIADDSYFDTNIIPYTWQWGDMGNYYGSGIYGLNIYDNLYNVYFQQQGKLLETPNIKRIVPDMPYLHFTNEVYSAAKGSGDNVYVLATPYSHEITLRGTLPIGSGEFRVRGAMPDPPFYAAYVLDKTLKNNGVDIAQAIQTLSVNNNVIRNSIHTHYSPSLFDISKHINEESRNLYSEALVKAIGLKVKNKASFEAGLLAIEEFWKARGVDMGGAFLHDGSGLSARNAITARILASILRKAYIDESFCKFYDQLAIAGVTGTIAHMKKSGNATKNLRAKTGSLNRVRSYSGYFTTKSGKNIAFSILVNNYTGSGMTMKQKIEDLLVKMAAVN